MNSNLLSKKLFIKAFLFVFLVFLTCDELRAQEFTSFQRSNYGVKAASLGLFKDNLSNNIGSGSITYSIPIYTIKCAQHEFPISISYVTGGIKVNQIASEIGLGWNLNNSGMISREIRGVPDEVEYNGYLSEGGYIMDHYLADGELNGLPEEPPYEFTKLLDYAEGIMDGQPDVYSFNTADGLSGKFIFDRNGGIHLVGDANDKLMVTYEREASLEFGHYNHIIQFTITDQNGIKYLFGNGEVEKVMNHFYSIFVNTTSNYTDYFTFTKKYNGECIKKSWDNPSYYLYSSWFLKKIIYPDTDITLDFEYDSETHYYYSGTEERMYKGSVSFPCYGDPTTNPNYPFFLSRTNNYIQLETKRLRKIISNNIDIDFLPCSGIREDMNDPSIYNGEIIGNAKAINEIVIKNNEEVIECDLGLSYFYPQYSNVDGVELSLYPSFFKRLRLDWIIIGDKKWEFDYFQSNQLKDRYLPSRNSSEVDYWGYYKENESKISIPAIYVTPGDVGNPVYHSIYSLYPRDNTACFLLPGVNRAPTYDKLNNTKTYSLEKITLPTKGSIHFEYEQNTFIIDGAIRVGPGIRIKSITEQEPEGGSISTETYNYYEGKISKIPEFGYANIEGLRRNFISLPTPLEKYEGVTTRINFSFSSLGNTEDSRIYYGKVVQTLDDGSISEFYYESPQIYAPLNRLEDYYDTFIWVNWIREHYEITDRYPFFIPQDEEWAHNQLKKVIKKTDDYKTVQEILYEYEVINEDAIPINILQANLYDSEYKQYVRYHVINKILVPCLTANVAFNDIVWSVYQYLPSYKILNKITTKDYTSLSHYIETIQDINYSAGLKSSSQITNSNGDIILDQTIYLNDFKCSAEDLFLCETDKELCLKNIQDSYFSTIDNCKITYWHDPDELEDCYNLAKSNYLTNLNICLNNYNTCLLNYENINNDIKLLGDMKAQHLLSSVIEQNRKVNGKIVGGKVKEYKLFNNQYHPYKIYTFNSDVPVTDNSLFKINEDLSGVQIDHCQLENTINNYTTTGNILEATDKSGLSIGMIYGYNNDLLIAQCKNAPANSCGYTGFENAQTNLWNFSSSNFEFVNNPSQAHSGDSYMRATGVNQIFQVGNSASLHSGYKLSAWVKNAVAYQSKLKLSVVDHSDIYTEYIIPSTSSTWQLFEVEIPRAKYVSLINGNFKIIAEVIPGSTSVSIDDLRFHPMDAQMTSYTYKPLFGVTSISDANNKPTYFEYDGFGRLIFVRDFENNILKKYDYHYRPQ